MANIYQWNRDGDDMIKKRIASATERYCDDPLRKALFMVKTGQARLGTNMVKNPGFEEVWGEGAYAKCPPDKKALPMTGKPFASFASWAEALTPSNTPTPTGVLD